MISFSHDQSELHNQERGKPGKAAVGAGKGRPDRASAGNDRVFEKLHDDVLCGFADRHASQSFTKPWESQKRRVSETGEIPAPRNVQKLDWDLYSPMIVSEFNPSAQSLH
jgi:hypothetical protein